MHKLSVLLVDDNQQFRKAARELVSALPCVADVRCAESGEEALAVVRHARPDVVLTDIAMPGMSGFGLIRALRNEGFPLRIVVTTLHEGSEFRAAARRSGVDALIAKHDFVARVPELIAALAQGSSADGDVRGAGEASPIEGAENAVTPGPHGVRDD